MDKAALHHTWRTLRKLKPWYFFILAGIWAVICVYALIQNNKTMGVLRNDVFVADKNNGDVNSALERLQTYVTSHMNTNLSIPNGPYPPIQLEYTYQRLTLQATQTASASQEVLYTDAQTYCQQQDSTDFSGHNRVPCIEQYVQSHGVTVQPVPASLYKFNFLSPTWSPDLAGWSMVTSGFFAFVCVVLLATDFWFHKKVL